MAASTSARRWLAAAGATLLVLLGVAMLLRIRVEHIPDSAAPGTGPPPVSTFTVPTTSPPTTSAPPAGPTTTTPTTATPTKPPVPPTSPFPPALRGQDITVIPAAGKVVALTFDAGANSAGLTRILRSLADAGIRGTFFVTGNWALANPGGVAAIRAAGHRVGNHSMSHPDFTGLSDAAIADQLRSARQAIQAAGADPRPLFRFPLGARDPRTIATVNNQGYVPIRWTVDTLGWKGTSGGISAQQVTDRAIAALRPGEIILMHIGSNPDDGSTLDADALPGLITQIRAAGYQFVTLDAVLGR